MKIIELRAENVKRLVAAQVEPDGSLVVVSGKNGAGKSSLIDSIAYALGGKDLICDKPLRKGAKNGRTVVTIGEEGEPQLVVTRTFNAKGGTSLKVENAAGAPQTSPQKLLDKLVGPLSFDPLGFKRMPPREQAETLRKLVGLDFSEQDAKRQKLYDQRRDVNRDVTSAKGRLDGMIYHAEAPKTEESIEALTAELEAADDEMRRREGVERAITAAKGDSAMAHNAIRGIDQEISECEARIEEMKQARVAQGGVVRDSEADAARMAEELEATPPPDAGAIRERVVQAEAANAMVRENRTRAAQAATTRKLAEMSDSLSRQITNLDDSKAEQIAAAEMPVEGLGFDEYGVTVEGLPFAQASSAEQLAVSVAMGIAMNPKLKLLLIRDGSLLDADHRALIAKMAEEADAQVWMECVETNESTSVVIVDGTVKDAA